MRVVAGGLEPQVDAGTAISNVLEANPGADAVTEVVAPGRSPGPYSQEPSGCVEACVVLEQDGQETDASQIFNPVTESTIAS